MFLETGPSFLFIKIYFLNFLNPFAAATADPRKRHNYVSDPKSVRPASLQGQELKTQKRKEKPKLHLIYAE